jgi:hypothetical protein
VERISDTNRESIMPHDVFIGYSRHDSKEAEVIEKYLTEAGISCFRDINGISDSAEWVEVITTAIEECHVYPAIVSRNSLGSRYVDKELAFAGDFDKPCVAVLLARGIELPKLPRWPSIVRSTNRHRLTGMMSWRKELRTQDRLRCRRVRPDGL